MSCCPFGHDKPVCAKCKVHCYKPAYKEKISVIMRFAAPRVVFKHPFLSLEHLWKSAPVTPPEKPRAKPRAKPAPAPANEAATPQTLEKTE